MIRSARTKIAAKVSKLDSSEDFQYAKWLRTPKIKKNEFSEIRCYEDVETFDIEKFIVPSSSKFKFKFAEKGIPDIKQKYLFENPKAYLIFFGLAKPPLFTLKEKFLVEPKQKDFKSSFAVTPKIIDQSNIFIIKPSLPTSYDIDFTNVSVSEIPLLISPPQIKDYLASLVPEIYKIELLNVERLENSFINAVSYEVSQLKYPEIMNIEVPGIDDIIKSTSTSISIPFEQLYESKISQFSLKVAPSKQTLKVKIDLPKTVVKKVVIKQANLEAKIIDFKNDKKISDAAKLNINAILSSFAELSWEEFIRVNRGLSEHEIEDAQFLAENNFAVLSDELGYEKYNQSITSIKFLFRKGNAKSAIIISDQLRFAEGWQNALNKFGKDLVVRKIDSEAPDLKCGLYNVLLIDFNDFSKIDINAFGKIDLVLFDELLGLTSSSGIIEEFIKQIEPNYLWILSAVITKEYNSRLVESFSFSKKVSFEYFGKSLAEIQKDDPVVQQKDFWLPMDEMQSFEYSEAMTQTREELKKLVENPNPLRFQSNIFTIIHKLKQILNFSSFRNISPKANLLIEQAEAIQHNKKRAIVFTQYDANGIQKIEKALDINNIKHLVVRNGISHDDLIKTMSSFYERKDIPLLVTNIKPSRLSINLSKVSYIINFDQWWNPAATWQNEDDIGLSEIVESPVTVLNYFIKNSFEEELEWLLKKKGLLNKYLFENLKSETISEMIPMNDWLIVFGMEKRNSLTIEKEVEKLLPDFKSIELNEFRNLIVSFFASIGYREINIMDVEEEPTFYVTGSARKGSSVIALYAKCIIGDNLTKEDYDEVIYVKPGHNEIKRKFVITNGTYSGKIPPETSTIDGKEFTNYLVTLGLQFNLPIKKS